MQPGYYLISNKSYYTYDLGIEGNALVDLCVEIVDVLNHVEDQGIVDLQIWNVYKIFVAWKMAVVINSLIV